MEVRPVPAIDPVHTNRSVHAFRAVASLQPRSLGNTPDMALERVRERVEGKIWSASMTECAVQDVRAPPVGSVHGVATKKKIGHQRPLFDEDPVHNCPPELGVTIRVHHQAVDLHAVRPHRQDLGRCTKWSAQINSL